jgi:hypothetical protein
MAQPPAQQGVIAKRYTKLSMTRQPFLDRGRECSALTVTHLLPPEGTKDNKLRAPYNGIGGQGVESLTSKLTLALFPSNLPFFRLAIDDFALAELTQDANMRGEAEKGLNKIERAVAMDVSTSALRVPLGVAIEHLIVTGNVLFFRDPESGRGRAIPLSHYVVVRDPLGNVLEFVVEEEIGLALLPPEVAAQITAGEVEGADPDRPVKLYTHVVRKARKWDVEQEAAGIRIESASGSYPLDQCPWLPLRFTLIDGEDYGRSFVEGRYADLSTLELLTKALVKFSAAAAKVVFGVRTNSTTKARDLAKAESGDFVNGDLENDVTTLQLNKAADFQVASAMIGKIEDRLAYAFMLNSALQRNGERVTAEEIKRLAAELDSCLGGIHALLAQELQLPLVQIIMASKVKRRELPKLPKGFVKPVIVTGVDALGRGSDLDNLMTGINALAPIPNALARLKGDEVGKRVFAALQVSTDGLFMSDEEVQQQQQQQAMQQMAQAATPAIAKAATEGAPAQ